MLIIDTGVLVSIADTTDPHHDACATLLRNETEPLVTTAVVIAETAYLLDRDLGPRAEALLYQMILDDDLHIDALTIEDWQRVHDLVVPYADLRLGGLLSCTRAADYLTPHMICDGHVSSVEPLSRHLSRRVSTRLGCRPSRLHSDP